MILYATVVPYNYNPVESEALDPSEVKILAKNNFNQSAKYINKIKNNENKQ